LNRKEWQKKQQTMRFNVTDTVFIGSWVGALSQFGGTSKFVLHLNKNDEGAIVPSLDSPDQDVFGIPTSDLQLIGDQISFRLGVASAVFYGTLERESMTIKGTWTQRGVDYPLNLSKDRK
jgi:hypothetical protein